MKQGKYKNKVVAVYKGDELLSMGTIKEVAAELGIDRKSVSFYGTPTYVNKTNGLKSRRLIIVD